MRSEICQFLYSRKTVWCWLPHGCAHQRGSFVKLRLLSNQWRNRLICGWVQMKWDTADRSPTSVGAIPVCLMRRRPWNVTLITPRPSLFFVANADNADDARHYSSVEYRFVWEGITAITILCNTASVSHYHVFNIISSCQLFLPRDVMLAWYMLPSCVRLSVTSLEFYKDG